MRVVYVTKSEEKKRENQVFVEHCKMGDGAAVKDLFEFELRAVEIKEILEVELETMVRDEVSKAYGAIKVPCIVEHAGLIFDNHSNYPGGLTKPMWQCLGSKFLDETGSAGRAAIALAVVAYCDGKRINVFKGETKGRMADVARGSSCFYWDTVFMPDGGLGKTYAEIVDDPKLGIVEKVTRFSQSSKAMVECLEFLRSHKPELWP